MRLIDADAFIDYANKRLDIFADELITMIEEQPTAYDVSKVVAELKEKKDEASIVASKRSVRIGEDEYEDDTYYEGKKYAYGHAIELLRKGGV